MALIDFTLSITSDDFTRKKKKGLLLSRFKFLSVKVREVSSAKSWVENSLVACSMSFR